MKQIRFEDLSSVRQRALLLGHFSTAGDIQCLEFVVQCLSKTGLAYDVLAFGTNVRSALKNSISPAMAEPSSYTHLIVVCGPCWPGLLQNYNFNIDHYKHCKRIGINLTMVETQHLLADVELQISEALAPVDLESANGAKEIQISGTPAYFDFQPSSPEKRKAAAPHFKSLRTSDIATAHDETRQTQETIAGHSAGKPVGSRHALLRELVGLDRKPEPNAQPEDDEKKHQTPSPRRLSSAIEFDADGDCCYARSDRDFSRVAHIFHQNWHGIRSAAGVQPGHKVAIPLDRPLRRSDLLKLVSQLEEWHIQKAIFHGFSDVAERAVRAVCAAGIECFLVWHGNLSQLAWKPEALFFERAMTACRQGIFRRAHMMKSGMGLVFPRSYEPMLLNCPPITNRHRLVPAFNGNRKIALVPAFPDIRKNLHSSLLGAALSSSIQEILYYGKIHGSMPETARCKRVLYTGHSNHLAFLHDIDVSVNVTTIDCHPMVDMEALGAGAMALSGPLFLDALAEHPYTLLSVIANPFNVREIGKRLDYLSSMNNSELQDIISDYASEVTRVSRKRYSEFLNL